MLHLDRSYERSLRANQWKRLRVGRGWFHGVASRVAHPATMTYASLATEEPQEAGMTGGLLRRSVGIESGEDLGTDLRAALDRASASRPALVA